MGVQLDTWCQADGHADYELFRDFNAWIIAHIEQERGLRVFAQEIRDTFGKTGSLEEITLRLSELFNDTLITTNYDSLLEQVFATDGESRLQVINGVTAMTLPDPDKTTIIKIHGDFKDPTHCILGKSQYDSAYGETALDLDRPIPRMLARYYRSNSLLFLGCSLRSDRTLQVFQAAMKAAGDTFLPPHFALVQAPETLAGLGDRNAELANLGIAAIWYPGGQHDMVEEILGLAQADLNFRKSGSSRKSTSARS